MQTHIEGVGVGVAEGPANANQRGVKSSGSYPWLHFISDKHFLKKSRHTKEEQKERRVDKSCA